MKLQWSIQPRHTQLALDHVIHLNYRSMYIWPPIRLDNIIWSFTFDSIIRFFWSFWHNYISLWECRLIFLLDGIAFGLLKNHTLYFWSLSLFPIRILVYATGFCSSISLFIWRALFNKNKKNKEWEDIWAQVYACLKINKNHSLIIHDKFEDLFTIVT